MKAGVLIMTALVPTVGHQYLVEFAANFMGSMGGELDVIIFDRKHEPVEGYTRKSAFQIQFAAYRDVGFYVMRDDKAPQNDDGTQAFWDYWVNITKQATSRDKYDFVFASEAYGKTFADQLGAAFVPCDIDREVIRTKGTDVRRSIKDNWHQIMPEFRRFVTKRITFFGAESTGKTTMARHFSQDPNYGGLFLHEWARPYLERFGPEVTDERMEIISRAQYAAQQAAVYNPQCGPFIYQDTDLLSTIGYYRIYNGTSDDHEVKVPIGSMFVGTQSHLYIVMNGNIPFTPDPLRYGGNVRESSDQFWIDLLDEYECNYYVVESTGKADQIAEISKAIDDFTHKSWYDIAAFIRD